MPPTVYLLDGHALAYRAYFALTGGSEDMARRWMTSSGEPTAAVYGFASILLRLLEHERPDYLAISFDTGRTFRDDLFPEYKATRAKMPDDLVPQIERIRQLVDAFNIPRVEVEGYEADDVLGSLARWAADDTGLGVKIVTGDRDLLQLVSERVIVSLPGRQLSDAQDYTPERVFRKYGVRPEQFVDFKALVGDKSDNIPGVRGIGEKTAAKLLQQYGDLDNLYAHLDELSPSLRKKLGAGREDAYLSRELARIVTDLPVRLDLEQARPDRFDPARVETLFRALEFRSLMKRFAELRRTLGLGVAPQATQLPLLQVTAPQETPEEVTVSGLGFTTHIVQTPEALQALVRRLSQAQRLAVDTETTSTDQMRAELVGLSLALDDREGYYIPVAHRTGEPQLPWEQVREALRPALEDPDLPKVGHNLKYDIVVLARHGLRVAPLAFDTMIAEWLRDPASRNLGLKNLAWVRLGVEMTEIADLIGKGRKQISMAEVPVSKVAPYAAADVVMVQRLIPLLEADLRERAALRLFHEVEMPLVWVLAEMEMAGVLLDTAFLQHMSAQLAQRMHALEERIFQAVGRRFNLNSTQQLSKALFEDLGLKPPDRTRKTKSGYYSTSASVLEALRDAHPAAAWILEHRELAKLKSTYVDALPQQIHPETGRVHTSFNQTGTVTGRIASSDPNLQNIPIRTPIGREVRKAFIAPPDHLLLSVDYSQVELRIVAHIANDENMIAAFQAGLDIHAATAAAIYGVPLEAVTKEMRRHAKAVNFGLIYGMSPYGLTRSTDLTLAEAEDFVEAYFRQFPGVKRYIEETRRKATELGYVETLLGRRRYFPALQNPHTNRQVRQREEREAINAPIQGSAADIMKVAMLQVHALLQERRLPARMLIQVHDEVVLEVRRHALNETVRAVREAMEGAYRLRVPLVTDARVGPNWGEMEPVG
ncbi:MAG TPA: DNA polymerase I [Anaerolineae bacterium]|nr:DNA polymerase I [Anaerolineae bacterium]